MKRQVFSAEMQKRFDEIKQDSSDRTQSANISNKLVSWISTWSEEGLPLLAKVLLVESYLTEDALINLSTVIEGAPDVEFNPYSISQDVNEAVRARRLGLKDFLVDFVKNAQTAAQEKVEERVEASPEITDSVAGELAKQTDEKQEAEKELNV